MEGNHGIREIRGKGGKVIGNEDKADMGIFPTQEKGRKTRMECE